MPAKEQSILSRPLTLVLIFACLQLCVAFFTDTQTFTHEESMWHYIGRNWFRLGLTPYAGGVDNKSPLIFAVYGLSDMLFGINYWFPRITGIIVQSIGLLYLYKIALQLYSRQAAAITVTIYGLAILWRATGGKYVSFTETYAVAFIIIAVYHYLTATNNRKFFISGLLAGIALCWRLSAGFGIIAILIHSLIKKRNALIPFIVGLLCGLGVLILLAFAAGIDLNDLYRYAFANNFGGGSTTDHSFTWQLENFVNNFFYSELMLFYPPLIAYFFTKKQYSLLTIWLICEFIGINALGIYARPHFKQLLPALSLISGISIAYFMHQYSISSRNVMIIVWLVFFPKITEPLTGLKKSFKPPPDRAVEYCTAPYPRTDEQAEKRLGLWLKANTKPGDMVYVAGFGARVQLYSERLSPTIYFNVTQTPQAVMNIITSLNNNKPDVIVVPLFAEYKKYVKQEIRQPIDLLTNFDYTLDRCMYGYNIYRLSDTTVRPIGEFVR